MGRSLELHLLLLALTWVSLLPPLESISDEVSVLSDFKKAICDDPRSVLSDWNAQDKDHCSWFGVRCSSPHNRVVSLNLSDSSLTGFLTPALGVLSSLEELILDNNILLGPIPEQIGNLKSLKFLNLSVNQLSGPIPVVIGDLINISKLDLHSNLLTGTIPLELRKLANLVELRLDNNNLSGIIPGTDGSTMSGLCQLSRLKDADLSNNFFVGEIPSCLRRLSRSSFQGNCFQDNNSILNRPAQECTNDQEITKHKKLREPLWLLILEIATGAFLLVFLITGINSACRGHKSKSSVILPWRRIRTRKDQTGIPIGDDLLENVLKINRQELDVACEDFSNIIGSSTETVVYKGTMKAGPEIAVISLCISQDYWTSSLELYFQREVADLAKLNHENIAKLLGYCKECDPFSRMLVFEYASNGTLYEHLHYGDGSQFSWPRRMKIALGIARGLRYLHTEMQPPFAIAELTSSAVYLTEDFSPKLVDFERWRTVLSKPGMNSGCIVNGGSFYSFMHSRQRRYMDIQANTFAFGIILLELITGRPPSCKDRGCLVDWAMQYLEHPQEIGKIVDPELKNVTPETLSIICNAVSLCIEHEPTKRPSMNIITAILEGINISVGAILKDSPLAWAELAISS